MASLVCATCRKLIPPGQSAIRCTVASCNTGRMKLRFCSVTCWDKHVPTARHRKASYLVEGERDTSAGETSSPDGVVAEPAVDQVAEVGESSGKS